MTKEKTIEAAARADLPTRYGSFKVIAFRVEGEDQEYGLVYRGELAEPGLPIRLHSECFTGDVMGSLRCDCRDQLEAALRFVGKQERGAVLYLPQEGRGIGLANKIKAYALQDKGMDTVEANNALGFPDDLRRYDTAGAILRHLGVPSVWLLTNNPRKRRGLEEAGVPVLGMLPVRTPPNEFNAFYLETKRDKSGHLL